MVCVAKHFCLCDPEMTIHVNPLLYRCLEIPVRIILECPHHSCHASACLSAGSYVSWVHITYRKVCLTTDCSMEFLLLLEHLYFIH